MSTRWIDLIVLMGLFVPIWSAKPQVDSVLLSTPARVLGQQSDWQYKRDIDSSTSGAESSDDRTVIIGLALPRSASSSYAGADLVPTEDLINEIAETQATFEQRMQGLGLSQTHRYRHFPFIAANATTPAIEALKDDAGVSFVAENTMSAPNLTESTRIVGAKSLWSSGVKGRGQTVAVLDTGVDGTHLAMAGTVVAEACFSTTSLPVSTKSVCPNGRSEQFGSGSGRNCLDTVDGCDHGTHVAGIVAGHSPLISGMAPEATIVAVQVFSALLDDPTCKKMGKETPCAVSFPVDQLKGLDFVLGLRDRFNIAAVNMSLGGRNYSTAEKCDAASPEMKQVFETLRAAGIAPVVASGNDDDKRAISTPACVSSAISVGATDKQDVVADFSNSASNLTLLAPGVDIYSSLPKNRAARWMGTSMAAPHVAGAFALLRSARPNATVDQLLQALRTTGKSIVDPVNGVTTPRIQVDNALKALPAAPAGITGIATWRGQPEPNVLLRLTHWSSETGTVNVAQTTTDREGRYRFSDVPPGYNAVHFANEDNGLSTRFLKEWRENFRTLEAGGTVQVRTFDIADVVATEPDSDTAVSLPVKFSWSRVGAGQESYYLKIVDTDGTSWAVPRPIEGTEFAMNSLPAGLVANRQYEWYMCCIYSKDGNGHGTANARRRIMFSGAAQPNTPTPIASATPGGTDPNRAELRVLPSQTGIAIGDSGILDISLLSPKRITHFDLTVHFDPKVLRANELPSAGPALEGLPTRLLVNEVDNTTGVVRIAMALLGNANGVLSGNLIRIPLVGVANGQSVVSIDPDKTSLLTGTGDFVPFSLLPGQVLVEPRRKQVTGQLSLEGRLNHAKVVVSAGSVRAETIDDGTFSLRSEAGTVDVTARMAGYLSLLRPKLQVGDQSIVLPSRTLVGGDADGDDRVGDVDLAIVSAVLGKTVPPGDSRADIDGNALVDLRDVRLVTRNIGRSGPVDWDTGSNPISSSPTNSIAGQIGRVLQLSRSRNEQQDAARLWVEPPNLQVTVSGRSQLEIRLSDTDDVYAYDVELLYDPTVIRVLASTDDGALFSGRDSLVLRNEVDNRTGTARYSATLKGPGKGVPGNGRLVRLSLEGLSNGDSDLLLGFSTSVLNSDGDLIPMDLAHGHVTVGSGPAPHPTLSPTATPESGRSGIYGRVLANDRPLQGISLSLMRFDGATAVAVDQTTSGMGGQYAFGNAPTLTDGSVYLVAFLNEKDPAFLGLALSKPIRDYEEGRVVRGGDLEIAGISLSQPQSGHASSRFPITFQWTARSSGGNYYRLLMGSGRDPKSLGGTPVWTSSDRVRIGGYVLNGLPDGFDYGANTTWTVFVENEQSSGFALEDRAIRLPAGLANGNKVYFPLLARDKGIEYPGSGGDPLKLRNEVVTPGISWPLKIGVGNDDRPYLVYFGSDRSHPNLATKGSPPDNWNIEAIPLSTEHEFGVPQMSWVRGPNATDYVLMFSLNDDSVLFGRGVGGRWRLVEIENLPRWSSTYSRAKLLVGRDGTAHIMMQDLRSLDDPNVYVTYGRISPDACNDSSPCLASAVQDFGHLADGFSNDMALDSAGNPHLLLEEDARLVIRSRVNEKWIQDAVIDKIADMSLNSYMFMESWSLVYDRSNNAHVALGYYGVDSSPNSGQTSAIYYWTTAKGSSSPELVVRHTSKDLGRALIALGRNDQPIIICQQYGNLRDLLLRASPVWGRSWDVDELSLDLPQGDSPAKHIADPMITSDSQGGLHIFYGAYLSTTQPFQILRGQLVYGYLSPEDQ